MSNLAIWSSSRLDGGEKTQCIRIANLISTTHQWRGRGGNASSNGTATNTFDTGADDQMHSASCNAGEVATGFEVYSSGAHLDGRVKLRCTQLATDYTTASTTTQSINGFTVRGTLSAHSIPWSTGADNSYHITECPTGTYIMGIQVYASDRLDGELGAYCTGIRR